MDKFDLIVIGSGAGTHVASQAANEGLQVALVDQGPAGGTCLNNGCIPSKMLIYPADVIRTIQDAGAVGVHADVNKIDFPAIMSRMHDVVDNARTNLEETLKSKENLTYYQERAEFIDDYVLQVGGESDKTITAPKIVIATGARSLVPPIPGLLETGFLDNVSLLRAEGIASKPDHHWSGLHRLRIRPLLLCHGYSRSPSLGAARLCSKARTRKRQDWCKKCSPCTCG